MNEKVVLGIRVLLGLGMLIFGLNKFLMFIPIPPPATPEAGALMGAFAASGYILPIVGIVELVAGIAFLANKFVPLMAVILFPIMLNAFLFHAVLDPGGVAGAAVFTLLNILLMFGYKSSYDELLKP
ncbi:DoxX family membrane protein [Aureispira anguillae]|uniref:DoxX protein n=1 Tax=Aureispira anguillae TaxID=2864201 RepID=A0A915YBY2_9BACT|nr:DoxX family membrane protein [Aureispira anguillae]BDS10250.1 hypothetical protein AsAng_0009580 [Aureispira anguillae]